MTFESFWQRRVAATPQMQRAESMRINVATFRRELELAYEAGAQDARQIREAAERFVDTWDVETNGIMDLFRGIFGGKQ